MPIPFQQIPGNGKRVDSGPLKIGEDWCGYFFRGDHAAREADRLRMMAAHLIRLAEALEESDEKRHGVVHAPPP